jgi:hypothetical protein
MVRHHRGGQTRKGRLTPHDSHLIVPPRVGEGVSGVGHVERHDAFAGAGAHRRRLAIGGLDHVFGLERLVPDGDLPQEDLGVDVPVSSEEGDVVRRQLEPIGLGAVDLGLGALETVEVDGEVALLVSGDAEPVEPFGQELLWAEEAQIGGQDRVLGVLDVQPAAVPVRRADDLLHTVHVSDSSPCQDTPLLDANAGALVHLQALARGDVIDLHSVLRLEPVVALAPFAHQLRATQILELIYPNNISHF